MSVLDLVREDLRDFAGYSSARRAGGSGDVWLNANESAWRNPADRGQAGCNRYPEPQPARLRAALAALYGVREEQLLIGRGSDEAIDLLVRALCRAGEDGVVIAPPVFGMYAVCARLQGAPLIEVPLRDGDTGFGPDLDAMADAALQRRAKLLFLCSPGNPTGESLDPDAVLRLATRLQDRCVVVVDEAYVEFADRPSLAAQIDAQPNLAVLRTLSKAHALAAARIGVLLATPGLIAVLRNCQAPYPIPLPCAELALAGLQPEALQRTRERVAETLVQRERVRGALTDCAAVRRVYASQGNYLLARFDAADEALDRLLANGVVVRDMRAAPQLSDALRITIGSAEENDRLLAALRSRRAVP